MSEKVKVKIAREEDLVGLNFANVGKQVEMTEEDLAYIEQAFEHFVKAQEILEKYYSQE